MVAVTGDEAAAAIREGEALAYQMAAAQKLQGQDLEKEVAALKQVRADSPTLLSQTLLPLCLFFYLFHHVSVHSCFIQILA